MMMAAMIKDEGGRPSPGEASAPRSSTEEVKTQKVGKYQYLQTPGLMALNFFSAVGIVVANKALFRRGGELGFATSLTGLHFIATAIGVRICHALGIYEAKHLTQLQVLPITVAFCAFVAFNNISLQYNGVSFYQLMKILTTPAVVILQLVFFKVALPFKLLMTLAPICAGVALATANDTEVHLQGALWALAGLLAAAGYQVLVKGTQENLKVSSMQLLHHQAPQAAVMILLVSPLFDDTPELLSVVYRSFSGGASPSSGWLHPIQADGGGGGEGTEAAVVAGEEEMVAMEEEAVGEAGAVFWAGMVLLSCLLAFLVNLSTFLVIGRTSPVSYQVLGHFKLVVILVVGVAGFGEHSSPARLVGMALALAGIIAYTTLKQGLGSGWENRGASGGGSAGGGRGVELIPTVQNPSAQGK